MMSTDAILNATPTIPGELFGISGNFLALIIVFTGILIAAAMFTPRQMARQKGRQDSVHGLTISSLHPSVLLQ